jgi:hypothetical protein
MVVSVKCKNGQALEKDALPHKGASSVWRLVHLISIGQAKSN